MKRWRGKWNEKTQKQSFPGEISTPPQVHASPAPSILTHTRERYTHRAHPRQREGILSHSSRSQGQNPEQAEGGVEEPGRGAQAGRGRQRQRAGVGGGRLETPGEEGSGDRGSWDEPGPQEPQPHTAATPAREKERGPGRRAKLRERSTE